tara:strand:- start:46 stop:276 length:231 start_codon:yes stop_codon:yes gene_type:complete
MKPGDLVRFKPPYFIKVVDDVWSFDQKDKKAIGLLVVHEPVMGMTTILYQGKLLRVAARDAEKSGKKDLRSHRGNQ